MYSILSSKVIMCTHTRTRAHAHTLYTHTTHTHTCTHTTTHTRAHAHTQHTHMHAHTHMCTCTHTTHTCMQGLGKRLVKDFEINQHRSDNHISWSSSLPTYISTYKAGYSGSREGLPSYGQSTQSADTALLKKFHTPTKLTFRRFPRSHGFPEDLPNTKPTTCTTDWFQDGAYSTPLSVLAATQQPFLKHNPWTFSF